MILFNRKGRKERKDFECVFYIYKSIKSYFRANSRKYIFMRKPNKIFNTAI